VVCLVAATGWLSIIFFFEYRKPKFVTAAFAGSIAATALAA
jgi:uncharacterized membrane protein YjjB (DUF3815 family)